MDEDAEKLYETILKAANYFLHNCKTYPIEILADEDPSYEDIARFSEQIRKILHALMDDIDPSITMQAAEYCQIMEDMANAIVQKDDASLEGLVETLEKKPFALQ